MRALSARPRATPASRAPRRASVAARAEEAAAAKPAAAAKAPWSPPALDASAPAPRFGGSTGGLLRKAQVEEFYVLTWTAKKEAVFEMPTGGAAVMNEGKNLLKLARKEQCLALLNQLRSKFKVADGEFYRVFPNGEVQYLYPSQGTPSERVNAGRAAANTVARRIGDNASPAQIKFTGKLGTFDV